MANSRGQMLLKAAGKGAVAGLAGVAAMTAGEKLEQAVTGRSNSYVPARTLLSLLGRRPAPDAQPPVWNHAMHWGTGAVLGALRGVWSVTGIRGPVANTGFTAVRLATDQTLENATGIGAPPVTWPAEEQVVDILHKAVYAWVTGLVSDAWIGPDLESRQGTTSH